MVRLLSYFGSLTNGRIILWCYAIWYVVNVVNHFDARPRVWLTSIGLSAIIGTALLISTRTSRGGTTRLDGWQIFRLYLMPFCVSSFAALVKGKGFFLIFSPNPKEILMAVGLCGVLCGTVAMLKRRQQNAGGAFDGTGIPNE